MKKRILSLALALLSAAALAGCCGGSSGTATQSPPADCGALLQAMLDADDSFPEMTQVAISARSLSPGSSEYRDRKKTFSYISDLPFEQVESFGVAYSSDGRIADELAVICVTEDADADDAADSLARHKEDRLKLYQTYGPQEAARVEKGKVFTEGRYALLIICDKPDAVKEAFDSYLQGADKEG